MSIRIMSAVWGLDLPDSEMLILLALADWSNDDGECWPSIAQLAKKTRKGERTIQGAIKSMAAAGHLTRTEKSGKGCTYTLHPRSDCTPAAAAPRSRRTPAVSAPPQPTTPTPAAAAPNTSGHTTSPKASPSPKRTWPCPKGVDPAHWSDLLANRKSKRLTNTATALAGILRDLAKFSDDEWPPGRIVQHAAERGWGAIFDPRPRTENRNADHRTHRQSAGRPVDGFGLAIQRAEQRTRPAPGTHEHG